MSTPRKPSRPRLEQKRFYDLTGEIADNNETIVVRDHLGQTLKLTRHETNRLQKFLLRAFVWVENQRLMPASRAARAASRKRTRAKGVGRG